MTTAIYRVRTEMTNKLNAYHSKDSLSITKCQAKHWVLSAKVERREKRITAEVSSVFQPEGESIFVFVQV